MLSFVPSVTYRAGTQPFDVAVGDFTGSGNLDLAVVNLASNDVSILLGNGDGTFQRAVNYPAGDGPGSIAVGDFTGNGILDIAVGNEAVLGGTPSVSVLLGNGDGTFQPAVNYYGFSAEVGGIAVGDFTGTGILDLAVASDGVKIFLGNGDGTFQLTQSYGSGYGVATADLNGDGNLDLVTLDAPGNAVGVLLGNGDGTFQLGDSYSFHGPTGTRPVIADFNGDGNLDLSVMDVLDSQVGVFLGNGDGSFQSPLTFSAPNPQGMVATDFDGGSTLDLAVVDIISSTVGVYLGNGDGTFYSGGSFRTGGSHPGRVAVGDFNGDGYPDLVVTNGENNTVGVLLNDGNWSSAPGAGRTKAPDRDALGEVLTAETRAATFSPATQSWAVSPPEQDLSAIGNRDRFLSSATKAAPGEASSRSPHVLHPMRAAPLGDPLTWDNGVSEVGVIDPCFCPFSGPRTA
jgi:hypothetical protein